MTWAPPAVTHNALLQVIRYRRVRRTYRDAIVCHNSAREYRGAMMCGGGCPTNIIGDLCSRELWPNGRLLQKRLIFAALVQERGEDQGRVCPSDATLAKIVGRQFKAFEAMDGLKNDGRLTFRISCPVGNGRDTALWGTAVKTRQLLYSRKIYLECCCLYRVVILRYRSVAFSGLNQTN